MKPNQIALKELGDQAYVRLKKMILNNDLSPGAKIVQEKVALDLGISRTPLRDALKRLEAEYLVQSLPRRGVVVRSFSNEEIVQIFDCRMALEGTATRLLAEIATAKQKKELGDIFAPFQRSEKIDVSRYRLADIRFHEYLIENCGNKFITRLCEQGNIMVCIDRIGLIRPPEETLPEHLGILQAIQNNNPSAAEKQLKAHLENSRVIMHQKMHHES